MVSFFQKSGLFILSRTTAAVSVHCCTYRTPHCVVMVTGLLLCNYYYWPYAVRYDMFTAISPCGFYAGLLSKHTISWLPDDISWLNPSAIFSFYAFLYNYEVGFHGTPKELFYLLMIDAILVSFYSCFILLVIILLNLALFFLTCDNHVHWISLSSVLSSITQVC